jgi:hypothetical protein
MDGRGIKIEAARFSLLDRAFVASITSGSGAGGPIEVRTAENIELKGIGFETFGDGFSILVQHKSREIADRESSILPEPSVPAEPGRSRSTPND